jgi:nucleotide-binding universal stress UspA family protein
MTEAFAARLTLLHVIQTPVEWYGGLESPLPAAFNLPVMIEEAQKQLALFADFPSATPVMQAVRRGDPGQVIVNYASEYNADLIMLPTHGFGKVRSFLLGSVCAKILHDATCPVWTTAHAVEEPAMEGMDVQSILCAVDGSPESVALIRRAAEFTRAVAGHLRIVHVISAMEAWPLSSADPEFGEFLRQRSRGRIAELQQEAGCDVEIHIEAGEPAKVLRECALRFRAGLLIIGRGKAKESLGRLRSTGYNIIRESSCPVLSW